MKLSVFTLSKSDFNPRSGCFFEHDLNQNDEDFFKENLRVIKETFNFLCEALKGLKKQDTVLRKSIHLEKRVAIAFFTLGSCAEYRTIANLFDVGKSTVLDILFAFCEEVIKVCKVEYMDAYLTESSINETIKAFEAIGLMNCCGSVDGCHIEISPPADQASDYHNYKGWYSMLTTDTVLLTRTSERLGALTTLNYLNHQFILAKFNDRSIDIGNETAFKLQVNLMKPYPFGLERSEKKARFRRIGKGLESTIDHSCLIIQAASILHNVLNINNDLINQRWVEEFEKFNTRAQPEPQFTPFDRNGEATIIRDALANYLYEKRHSNN
uniref:CSON006974 protein n=1 Tax=Culicoides sonorensis TaxID=179676 RepID=A0A336M922_CULSO